MDKVNEPQKRRQLLLDEPPLIILPSLAVAVGLNEAIIVQQIHYWQAKKRAIIQAPKSDRIYNTIKDWQKQFPFFSTSLIRRALNNLEKDGIIISGNYNRNQADKTKSYSIDYDRLNEILESRLNNLENQTEEEEKDTGADVPHNEESYVESTEVAPEAEVYCFQWTPWLMKIHKGGVTQLPWKRSPGAYSLRSSGRRR